MTRKNGVITLNKKTYATHYKLKREKKDESIHSYVKKTGITYKNLDNICAQNRRSLDVQEGPSRGNKVKEKCIFNKRTRKYWQKNKKNLRGVKKLPIAAHVKLSGHAGIYIIPMCDGHNDSATGPPMENDKVHLKKGIKAVKVPDDITKKRSRTTKRRKKNSSKVKSKKKTSRRMRKTPSKKKTVKRKRKTPSKKKK